MNSYESYEVANSVELYNLYKNMFIQYQSATPKPIIHGTKKNISKWIIWYNILWISHLILTISCDVLANSYSKQVPQFLSSPIDDIILCCLLNSVEILHKGQEYIKVLVKLAVGNLRSHKIKDYGLISRFSAQWDLCCILCLQIHRLWALNKDKVW